MNCDQVFQHLASAKPASINGALEQHLNSCPTCREMAELFRPAVRLLVADPADDCEMTGETGNRWSQVWEAVSVAERTATQLDQHFRQSATRPGRSLRLLGMAGVLALGFVFGAVCTRANWPLPSSGATTSHTADSQQLPHRSHECRFDNLLDYQLQAGLAEFCSNCQPKVEAEFAGVITLCMVCHTRSGDGMHTRASPALE